MEQIKKEINKEEHKQQLHITKWTEETHKKRREKMKMRLKPTKNNGINNKEYKWTN